MYAIAYLCKCYIFLTNASRWVFTPVLLFIHSALFTRVMDRFQEPWEVVESYTGSRKIAILTRKNPCFIIISTQCFLQIKIYNNLSIVSSYQQRGGLADKELRRFAFVNCDALFLFLQVLMLKCRFFFQLDTPVKEKN